CCPSCRSHALAMKVFEERGDEVRDGAFTCGGCARVTWIVNGVPRMLPPELYTPPSGWRERERASIAAGAGANSTHDELQSLKQHTIQNFGFEWTEWGRY